MMSFSSIAVFLYLPPFLHPTLAGFTFNLNRRPKCAFFSFLGDFIIFSSLSGTNSSSTAICISSVSWTHPCPPDLKLSGCVWACLHACGQNVCVHTFTAMRSHTANVNSLFPKLLNRVTARTKAFLSFPTFCLPPLPSPVASWPQVGGLAPSILFFIRAVITDEKCMWSARVRLGEGLTPALWLHICATQEW